MQYAQGIYFNKKHEKAPDFVIGSISINSQKFQEWLNQQETDEDGYIRLKVNEGSNNKQYVAVDNWKPENKKEDTKINYPDSEINPDDIPF